MAALNPEQPEPIMITLRTLSGIGTQNRFTSALKDADTPERELWRLTRVDLSSGGTESLRHPDSSKRRILSPPRCSVRKASKLAVGVNPICSFSSVKIRIWQS